MGDTRDSPNEKGGWARPHTASHLRSPSISRARTAVQGAPLSSPPPRRRPADCVRRQPSRCGDSTPPVTFPHAGPHEDQVTLRDPGRRARSCRARRFPCDRRGATRASWPLEASTGSAVGHRRDLLYRRHGHPGANAQSLGMCGRRVSGAGATGFGLDGRSQGTRVPRVARQLTAAPRGASDRESRSGPGLTLAWQASHARASGVIQKVPNPDLNDCSSSMRGAAAKRSDSLLSTRRFRSLCECARGGGRVIASLVRRARRFRCRPCRTCRGAARTQAAPGCSRGSPEMAGRTQVRAARASAVSPTTRGPIV